MMPGEELLKTIMLVIKMKYEYQCPKCGSIHEVNHRPSDNPKVYCRKCQTVCKKIISTGQGFLLRGAGFHCNDYPKRK